MLSKAYIHYPQFRYRDEQKLLWNPILKRTFKNRPEERVRLQLIDYLILEANFSAHRISFESPVKLVGEKSVSRTDIICYTKDFEPHLLVECKAPDITLNEKTALQIARYNQQVGAPFLLVSNGMLDFWFHIEKEQVYQLSKIPALFAPSSNTEYSFSYWTQRAFAGNKSHPESRGFIRGLCRRLFKDTLKPIKFLAFEDTPSELALTNYYRIFDQGDDYKIALTLSATPYGGSRLNAILHKDGANVAFLSTSLDLIAEHQPDNTHLQSAQGVITLDLKDRIDFNFDMNTSQLITGLKKILIENS